MYVQRAQRACGRAGGRAHCHPASWPRANIVVGNKKSKTPNPGIASLPEEAPGHLAHPKLRWPDPSSRRGLERRPSGTGNGQFVTGWPATRAVLRRLERARGRRLLQSPKMTSDRQAEGVGCRWTTKLPSYLLYPALRRGANQRGQGGQCENLTEGESWA